MRPPSLRAGLFTLHLIAACGLFLQFSTTAVAQEKVQWVEVSQSDHRECHVYGSFNWDPKAGLELRIDAVNGDELVVAKIAKVNALAKGTGKQIRPYVENATHVYRDNLPAEALPNASLRLHFGIHSWHVYVDGKLCADLPAAFTGPRTLAIRENQLAADAQPFGVQKTGTFSYRESFMQEEDGPDPMADWTSSGEAKWNLYTAHEDAMINPNTSKLSEKNGLLPEYSPNFYSLAGLGKGALVRGYNFLDNLSISAAIRLQPGTAGVILNWQGPGDYTVLTVTTHKEHKPPLVRLERHSTTTAPRIRKLAEQPLRNPINQWIRLELQSRNNRLIAIVDDVTIADESDEVVPYGKFGVYCDGETPARFDDLIVERDTSPILNTVKNWRLHAAYDPTPSLVYKSLVTLSLKGEYLQLGKSKQSRLIGLGPDDAQNYRFSARFEPDKQSGAFGLIAALSADKTAYLRFERNIKDNSIRWALIQESATGSKELAASTATAPTKPPITTLLTVDLHDDVMRFYEDDVLVLAAPKTDAVGASGVWASDQFSGRVHSLAWRDNPVLEYRNRYEKNRNFVKDPYMRHWSSPEGEWLQDAKEKTRYWFKGDTHGRIELTLPVTKSAKAVLGAELDSPQGQYVVQLSEDEISLSTTGDAPSLATAKLKKAEDKKERRSVKVYHEGRWCWAKQNDNLLWLSPLSAPLQGRRIWIEGFSSNERGDTLVDRTQVADYLFTQAPSGWIVNGGTWQVTNRFQCQPRWSHMSGENEDGLAAQWSKTVFEGDFCVELYGGSRHSSYKRVGDINFTIGSSEDGPNAGSGYTIVTTGWDRDHSQLQTRLLRNGEELATSDKYLIPRYRQGNVRKSRNPIISSGRPVHGAWYYLKLRKTGKRLQFWFDNELVFDVEDPKPLNGGRFGIWTYRNAIMIARAKISAEKIRPAKTLLPNRNPFDLVRMRSDEKKGPEQVRAPRLLINGFPPRNADDAWAVQDPVGHSTLEILPGRRPHNDAILVTNQLGAGPMQLRNEKLSYRADQIVGWQFDLARGVNTKLHAWYVIGTEKSKAIKVYKRYCHEIDGETPRPDLWQQQGSTIVPPAEESVRRGIHKKDWHPVTIWLPIDLPDKLEKYTVKFLGLGIFEPGDTDNGIAGNPPGSWYAMRNFRPIYEEAPDVRLDASSRAPSTILAIDNASNRLLRRDSRTQPSPPPALAAAVRQPNPLNEIRIRMTGTRNFIQDTLISYLGPSNPPAVTWSWDAKLANTVVATPIQQIPDRRLLSAKFLAAGLPLSPEYRPNGSIAFEVPVELTRAQHPNGLPLSWQYDKHVGKEDLSWSIRAKIAPPRLLSIDGLPVFETFEDPTPEKKPVLRASATTSQRNRAADGSSAWLTITNNGDSRRLSSSLSTPESLAKFPLLGIRHAAGPMVNLSASVGSSNVGSMSEAKAGKSISIIPFDKTGSWQDYLASLPLAVTKGGFSPKIFSRSSIRIASASSIDQTGLYSKWHLDEIVLGPALNKADTLQITPKYASTEPIARVETATLNGPAPVSSRGSSERDSIAWRTVEPGKQLPLNFDNVADGIAKILVRAVDHNGRTSPISEIPILLDRKAPTAKAKQQSSTSPATPGFVLAVSINTSGGAPINPEKLKLTVDDKPLPYDDQAMTFTHSASGFRLQINWALLLREQSVAASKPLVISGITDGAGNQGLPLEIPLEAPEGIEIRPVYSTISGPEHVYAKAYGYTYDETDQPFPVKSDNKTRLVRSTTHAPYVESRPHGTLGTLPLATIKTKGKKPTLTCEIQHPKLTKADPGRIYLVVRHSKGKETICLNAAAVKEHADYPKVANLLPDTIEQWHTLSIPIGDLLKNRSIDYNEPLAITISRAGVRKDQALRLRNLWITDSWHPSEKITLSGYSGSPVRSMQIRNVTADKADNWQTVNSLTIPASRLKGPLGSWLEVQLLDDHKNASHPLRIPRLP